MQFSIGISNNPMEVESDEERANKIHDALISVYGTKDSEYILRSFARSDRSLSKEDDDLLERFYPTK